MPKCQPVRTVLVVLMMLALSLSAEAKKPKRVKKVASPAVEAPQELPPPPLADDEALPGTSSPPDSREPAQQGPGITESEKPANGDIYPGSENVTSVSLDDPPPSEVAKPEKTTEAAAAKADAAIKAAAAEKAASTAEPTAEEIQALKEAKAAESAQDLESAKQEAYMKKAESEAPTETSETPEAAPIENLTKYDTPLTEPSSEQNSPIKRRVQQTPRKPAEETEESSPIASTTTHQYTWASPRHFGLDINFSPARYPSLVIDSAGTTVGKTGNGIRLGFEWMFFQDAGKFAVGLGAGYSALASAVNSVGQVVSVNIVSLETLVTWRADFIEHQILVPFVRAGVDFGYVPMKRNDLSGGNGGSYQGSLFGGGLELCLFILEKKTSRVFDRKFGVNDTYFIFEYLKSKSVKSARNPDLSHDEFRIGLRFEI